MNIIDKWREITTCKDCCKAIIVTENNDPDHVICNAVPDAGLFRGLRNRCDSGVWLFRGDYSGRNYFPVDLWKYLRLCADAGSDLGISVIPRDQWPEVSNG